jgi:peptide/nickel transport system substrate-binding protein
MKSSLRSRPRGTGLFAPAVLAIAIIVAACQPSQKPEAAQPVSESPSARQSRSLVIAMAVEPIALVLPVPSRGGGDGGEIDLAVHQWLAKIDERGVTQPMLATELPSRERGTWVIRPDGTMQTTYRLRPDVTWHDGTKLTSKDFVFGWQVLKDPELATTKAAIEFTSAMTAPDDSTVVIQWSSVYPLAGELADPDFVPLPSHLIGDAYTSHKESFEQLPYWTRAFVGVGPYQMGEWQDGSHLVLRVYPRFYGGRAKLDRIEVRFIGDPNAVVAGLLAGAVDGAIPPALEVEQAMVVRREWEQAGKRPVIVPQPESWRHVFVQFRDPRPSDVLDVRVRRALLHAIDRDTMSASLSDGLSPVSHAPVPPSDPKWDWVQDVVVRYPYDPRRAQQLLAEAGWRRNGDGPLVDATGRAITLPIWAVTGDETTSVLAIIADYWKALGVTAEQTSIPRTQYRDLRYRASFPAFLYAGISTERTNVLRRVSGRECPMAESEWVGTSLGCYQNADLDRAIDGIYGAIDPAQQRQYWREFTRLQSEELPVLPMFFRVIVTVFREGATGVKGHTQPLTRATWNVAEWDIQ